MQSHTETTIPLIDRTELWFSIKDEEVSPETRLWRAVLVRSFQDAVGYTNITNAAQHRQAISYAQNWFLDPPPSYRAVCQYADIDADEMRGFALTVITQYRERGIQPDFIASKRRKPRRRQVQEAA